MAEKQNNEYELDENMESPQILLFDCDENVKEVLQKKHYSFSCGTLGEQIKVATDDKADSFANLTYNYPKNLHEYDIFIIDMKGRSVDKETEERIPKKRNQYLFKIEYPNRRFFAKAISAEQIKEELPYRAIYIVFASEVVDVEYQIIRDTTRGLIEEGKINGCNYDLFHHLYKGYLSFIDKCGKKIKVASENVFSDVLRKNLKQFEYSVVFNCPDNGCFVPLLFNHESETVGFVYCDDEKQMFFLPQIEDKASLLLELFDILSDIRPEVFPCLTQFRWIREDKYLLPNEKELYNQIENEKTRHERALASIDEKFNTNREKYSFLHDLLIETGDSLVTAVIKYLKWLEFDNVIDVDKSTDKLREDIDVFYLKNLLIIEVKGIGGTSTDSECSQISKHRRRKEKEHRELTIYPLYIVNHQRYQPPTIRDNPPFTQDQIDYAISDERGLLTTYQLYKWYYLNRDGILTKKEIRNQFLKNGNIPLLPPTYFLIGKIDEYYAQPNAFILQLINCKIRVADQLLFYHDGKWFISEVESMKHNDITINEAENGEIGFVVKDEVGKGYEVYIKRIEADAK